MREVGPADALGRSLERHTVASASMMVPSGTGETKDAAKDAAHDTKEGAKDIKNDVKRDVK